MRMSSPGSRPRSFESLRRLPLVGRALDMGLGPGAASDRRSAQRPDRGAEGHRVGLPVLRRGLRSARVHARRRAGRHRGQSAVADQPGDVVPEGRVLAPAGGATGAADEGEVPPAGRHRMGGTRARAGDGHDRRPGDRRARGRLAGHRPPRLARGPHAGVRPPRAGRPSTTRRTTSSRSCSPRWGRCRSRTRREYDTAPRSPVWGHRSGAAAPPTSSRTSRTPTAS